MSKPMKKSSHKTKSAPPAPTDPKLTPDLIPAGLQGSGMPAKTASPMKFFLLWFGIPMLLILALAVAMARS